MKKTTVKFSFPHYNGQFHIKMEGPELSLIQFTQKEKRVTDLESDGSGNYILRKHECAVPIYSFGFLYDNPEFRPSHGGEWSSNPNVIALAFGIQLVEVIYNNSLCAIPLEWLKKYLDNWVWFDGTKIKSVALKETTVEVKVDDNETFESTPVEIKTVSIPEDLYNRLVEYFDGRSDADFYSEGFTANEEMKLLTDLENCK